LTLDIYTHAELPENVEAAQQAGEAIEKAVNSGSLTANQEKGVGSENLGFNFAAVSKCGAGQSEVFAA
jgi:hypothetical protein